MKKRLNRISLSVRVFGALIAFFICFLLQLGFKSIRAYYVIDTQNKMISRIQNLSSFISLQDESSSAYAGYRWDYGDTEEFISKERARNAQSQALIKTFGVEYSPEAQEEYLLFRATSNLFSAYLSKSQRIMELLEEGKSEEASSLYYNDLTYCSRYLERNMQSLLEESIKRTRLIFSETQERNQRIDSFQSLTTLLSFLLAAMVALNLGYLLSSVRMLSRQSRLLGEGRWDIPDIREEGAEEIVNMAKAFNTMKHAMENQIGLLEEKNSIQEELFRKEKESLSLKNLLEEERLQQLRSRINPHFLFNTLNVIKYSASDEGAKNTEAMLESLSLLYRYALGSNSDSVPVSRELRIVVALSSLYRARFGEKVSLRWVSHMDEDLTLVMVPSFILQPIVENSFRHGIVPKEGEGEVVVEISSSDSLLRISISDNGLGMDEMTLERVRKRIEERSLGSQHIGIGNVAARVLMLSPSSSFEVESEKGKGTVVTMTLPLVVEEEEGEDDQDSSC